MNSQPLFFLFLSIQFSPIKGGRALQMQQVYFLSEGEGECFWGLPSNVWRKAANLHTERQSAYILRDHVPVVRRMPLLNCQEWNSVQFAAPSDRKNPSNGTSWHSKLPLMAKREGAIEGAEMVLYKDKKFEWYVYAMAGFRIHQCHCCCCRGHNLKNAFTRIFGSHIPAGHMTRGRSATCGSPS